jgi:hypothetical protein
MSAKKETYISFILDELKKGLNKSIPQRGYYVYAILENDKVCYIGKGKKNRVLSHFKGKGNETIFTLYKNSPNRYDWTILESELSEIESFEREKHYINLCKSNEVKLYNTIYNTKDYVSEKITMTIKSLESLIDITQYMYPYESFTKEAVQMSLNVVKHLYSTISDKVNITYKGINAMDLQIISKFYKDNTGKKYTAYTING